MTNKQTTTKQPKQVTLSTHILSIVVSSLLTAAVVAIAMWFFVTNVVNDYRGSIIQDIKAAASVTQVAEVKK